jgi:hypothetical protein
LHRRRRRVTLRWRDSSTIEQQEDKKMRRLFAGFAILAGLLAATAVIGPATAGKEAKSKTIKLFDGKDLKGWEGYDDLWSVEDGEIVGKNEKPISYSTYLLTKGKYRDFRLVLSAKLAKSEMHSGVAFWGKVFTMPDKVTDPKAARTEYTYRGHLVMFPSGYGMFDLYRRNSLPEKDSVTQAKWTKAAQKVGKQHDWNEIEILARGDRIRVAINGNDVLDYTEKDAKTISEGPIGLQLHSNGMPQEMRFKGLVLTTNPDDKLVTVK